MTEIPFPIPQITSMAFGGKAYDTMYVTTAGLDVVGPQTYPAGYLYKVTNLGVKGTEQAKFILN